jgi:chemotaxis protein MotB
MNSKRIETRGGVRMAAIVLCAGLGMALGLGGCTTQQNYDQLVDANRSLKDRNEELRRSNQELETEIGLLQRQRTANENAVAELTRVNSSLRQQLQAAGIALDEFNTRLGGLQLQPLDPETDRALSALAAQFPDIIRYDSARGMLRFASDVTFSSGSDQVQDGVRSTLQALAGILNSSAASPYEVMIVGHTDSQRISAGTAQRHPTNMHLSVHRAISVRSSLAAMGVTPERMYAAGWGEHRPVVANTQPTGNTPQNRRVEIYLTRSTGGPMESNTATSNTTPPPRREAMPTRQPDMTK